MNNNQKDTYLTKFLYGRLDSSVHLMANLLGLMVAIGWLYFTLIHKKFFLLFSSGQLALIDLLIGFPLIIALAPVLYALVYWLIKWIVIFFFPEKLTVPEIKSDDD